MKCQLIILILCTVIRPSFHQKAFIGKDLLTKEKFENSFKGLSRGNFQTNPTAAYLFLYAALQMDGEIKNHVLPLCSLNLVSQGRALVTEYCLDDIKEFQKQVQGNMQPFRIAYRCFPNNTQKVDPLVYELRTVTFDRIGRERGAWILFFTPKPDAHCSPKWLDEVGLDGMSNYWKDKGGDDLLKAIRIEGAEPFTKEQFEAAFNGPMKELFLNRQSTFLFNKHHETNKLVPVKQCFVTILENTKGLVQEKCLGILDAFLKLDDTMLNWLLPYRCYLIDNPDEYELHNTTVTGFGKDPEADRYIVTFKIPDMFHCKAKLASDEDEEINWSKIEL